MLQLRNFTDALNKQLAAASIMPEAAIAWPNATFVPVKGKTYLKVEMAGRSRRPVGFGADGVQQWTGIYQVGVFVPRDTGDREQDAIATKVLGAFPRGLNLTSNSGPTVIIEFASPAAAVVFGDWSNLPVQIFWFATEP